jgi:hypothetical protein
MSNFKTTPVSAIDMDADYNQSFGVMDFAHDLETASGLRTAPRDNQSRWVYRTGDTYALGWIGYGPFQYRGDAHLYTVYSPYIRNKKYGGGDHVFMAMSIKRPTAVKNALKYLRPLSMSVIIDQSRLQCRDGFNKMLTTAKENMVRVSSRLDCNLFPSYNFNTTSALRAELKHLVDTGYKFLDPSVGEQLSNYFALMQEVAEAGNRDPKFTFVEVLPDPRAQGGATLRVVLQHDVSRYYFSADDSNVIHETYAAADAPEDLLHKLAVLNMVEDGHYVEGVGYRESSRVFYLR